MKICVYTLLLLNVALSLGYAQETPREAVETWDKCYGTAEMDRCGDITTAKMRNDKPASVWVYDTWKTLERIEYKKEKSEIIKEEVDGNAAIVVVQAHIYTVGGVADQKELYKLIKVDDIWLIDELHIGDEILEQQNEVL